MFHCSNFSAFSEYFVLSASLVEDGKAATGLTLLECYEVEWKQPA